MLSPFDNCVQLFVYWQPKLSGSNSSFRFLPSRLLQLTVVWCVWRPQSEVTVNPEHRRTAHYRRQTMWLHHACDTPVALASCPATSRLQDRMSGALVADWFDAVMASTLSVANSGRRLLRSAADNTCIVPPTRNTFGDRSLTAAGPQVSNNSPSQLRHKTSATEQKEHERISETGVFPSPDRVSGTLCLSHYVTETSHLYSLRDFWRPFPLFSIT